MKIMLRRWWDPRTLIPSFANGTWRALRRNCCVAFVFPQSFFFTFDPPSTASRLYTIVILPFSNLNLVLISPRCSRPGHLTIPPASDTGISTLLNGHQSPKGHSRHACMVFLPSASMSEHSFPHCEYKIQPLNLPVVQQNTPSPCSLLSCHLLAWWPCCSLLA